MDTNRRQFERFRLSEDAIVFDEHGRRLGRVTEAGGGGMAIRLDADPEPYQAGEQLRVTVVEPASGIRHTLEVVVRFLHDGVLGTQFITGKGTAAIP